MERVYVDEGQTVTKGQVLFAISSAEHEQELLKTKAVVKSAEAELKTAQIELDNTKKLLDKNIVSQSELELVEAKVAALMAQIEQTRSAEAQAELNLSFTKVRAPFDGVINRIPNKVGSLIEEGELLTTISDNGAVFAYFNLSEADYLDYVKNHQEDEHTTVRLQLANGEMYPHLGVVETNESEFDLSTGNIAFRARFPNPENLLKHGAHGKVMVSNELEQALLVPQKSTFEIQDKLFVFVMGEDGTLEQRGISSHIRFPHFYVVDAGLTADETILYEGVQQVRNGLQIHSEYLPSEELLTQISRGQEPM
ncbi:MAG: efflux RND transporter periplasmic adaptor subunit [Cytophagales bacterium]|nr:efflux RND transporter periplasmic adaptor subunit [Cytophagales bacterium]